MSMMFSGVILTRTPAEAISSRARANRSCFSSRGRGRASPQKKTWPARRTHTESESRARGRRARWGAPLSLHRQCAHCSSRGDGGNSGAGLGWAGLGLKGLGLGRAGQGMKGLGWAGLSLG
eukprot:5556180-Prymnesium_polylepis.1